MKYYVVDAFAERVFEGNPAGVCVLDAWLPDALMQNIAMENNLSETAFTVKAAAGYHLRWFTPGGEIDLCGHATLATAYILSRFYEPAADMFEFTTLSGKLTVTLRDGLLEMDFPSWFVKEIPLTEQMTEALGAKPERAYLTRDLLLLFADEEVVAQLQPDFTKLAALPDGLLTIATAKSDKYDFVSRSFGPKLKVDEDPVTGSAHCTLIPYWSEKLSKQKMVARQTSKRGGTLYCQDCGERIKIAGKAVLYAEAQLQLDC